MKILVDIQDDLLNTELYEHKELVEFSVKLRTEITAKRIAQLHLPQSDPTERIYIRKDL